MKRLHKHLEVFSLAATLLAPTALGCRGYESELPPVHLIPNMDTQEKGRAYRVDTSGLFRDGRMMRAPVEGTVAVGQLAADALLHEGRDDAGLVSLRFPDDVKEGGRLPESLAARGKERYEIYCSPCHGVGLDGKGTMTLPGLDSNPRLQVPPPSFHDDRLKKMPAGQIYSAIKNGVNQGNMGSYAAQIPVKDRWAIIAYIRAEQKAKDPSVEPEGGEVLVVAAATEASVEHGAQLYKAKACAGCHTLDGNRLVGPSFKGLYGLTHSTSAGDVVADDAYLTESIKNPAAKIVTGYPPAMPPLPLTDLEVQSLVLFIQSVK